MTDSSYVGNEGNWRKLRSSKEGGANLSIRRRDVVVYTCSSTETDVPNRDGIWTIWDRDRIGLPAFYATSRSESLNSALHASSPSALVPSLVYASSLLALVCLY